MAQAGAARRGAWKAVVRARSAAAGSSSDFMVLNVRFRRGSSQLARSNQNKSLGVSPPSRVAKAEKLRLADLRRMYVVEGEVITRIGKGKSKRARTGLGWLFSQLSEFRVHECTLAPGGTACGRQ